MRKKSTCLQVFKSLNGLNPEHINNMFAYQGTNRTLRSTNDPKLAIPRTRTVKAESNIRVRGVTYWNEVDDMVRQSTTVSNFKSRMKNFDGFEHV